MGHHKQIFSNKRNVLKKNSKGKHCTHSSGDGESCSKLRCKIVGIKGDHFLDENSMRNILSLADVADRFRVKMKTSVDDEFFAQASKGVSLRGRT